MATMRLILTVMVVVLSVLANAKTLKAPFHYRITAPNGNVSFLLGTVHGAVDISELPKNVISNFDQSRILVNEWQFSDEDIKSIQSGKYAEAKLRSNHFEGEKLSSAERRILVNKWGIDKRLAARAKSHDCSLIRYSGPVLSGYMDVDFMDRALKTAKPILSLDTQELRDYLDKKYPDKCDLKNLLIHVSAEMFRSLQMNSIQNYRSGNEEAFESIKSVDRDRTFAWINTVETNWYKEMRLLLWG